MRNKSINHQTWELDPQLHGNWTLSCMGTGPSITGPSIVRGQKWEPNNQLLLALIVRGGVKSNGCAISGLKYDQHTTYTHSTNTFTWVSYTPRICTAIVGRHTTMHQNDPVTWSETWCSCASDEKRKPSSHIKGNHTASTHHLQLV